MVKIGYLLIVVQVFLVYLVSEVGESPRICPFLKNNGASSPFFSRNEQILGLSPTQSEPQDQKSVIFFAQRYYYKLQKHC